MPWACSSPRSSCPCSHLIKQWLTDVMMRRLFCSPWGSRGIGVSQAVVAKHHRDTYWTHGWNGHQLVLSMRGEAKLELWAHTPMTSCQSSCVRFHTDSRQQHIKGGNYLCMEVVQRFLWQSLYWKACHGAAYGLPLGYSSHCCVQGQSQEPPCHHKPQGRWLKSQLWERPAFLVGHKLDESSGRGGLTLPADIKIICRKEELHCSRVEAVEA